MFFKKGLSGIIKTFTKVQKDLEDFIDKKGLEHFDLKDEKAAIEKEIEVLLAEVQKAEKILTNVANLLK